jgi:hypothetical protein
VNIGYERVSVKKLAWPKYPISAATFWGAVIHNFRGGEQIVKKLCAGAYFTGF